MPDQADQRLDLRDWCQDAGRLHRHIGQARTPVTTDAVAGEKISLEIKKLWNDRQDRTQTASAAENGMV